jgi:hypothetical protein
LISYETESLSPGVSDFWRRARLAERGLTAFVRFPSDKALGDFQGRPGIRSNPQCCGQKRDFVQRRVLDPFVNYE